MPKAKDTFKKQQMIIKNMTMLVFLYKHCYCIYMYVSFAFGMILLKK